MVREVVVALGEWLVNPDQEELRRSFLIWLQGLSENAAPDGGVSGTEQLGGGAHYVD